MKKIKFIGSKSQIEYIKKLCSDAMKPKYTSNTWFSDVEIPLAEGIYVEMDFPMMLSKHPILGELSEYKLCNFSE